MTEIIVRALHPEDDRSGFSSGDEDLDRFFRKYAGQNQFKHHLGVTYVATAGEVICGFVTVSAGSIEIEDLPVLRLARLATAPAVRGIGVGKLLLRFALQLACDMSDELGCVGVVVDAKEDAVSFYERYGFESFPALEGESNARPAPQPMFLPLGSIPRG